MSELEVVRLIGEIVGVLVVVFTGARWLGSKFLLILQNQNQHTADIIDLRGDVAGINRRLDTLNGTVAAHEGRLNNLEGWREGHKD